MRYFLTLLVCIFSQVSFATLITSNSDGNWSTGSTWVGGVPPGASDSVNIQSGHDITVTSTTSCGVIILDGNSNTTTLTVNGSQTLTCTRLHITPSGTNQTVNLVINGALTISNGFQIFDDSQSGTVLNISGSGRISATGYANIWTRTGMTVNVGATFESNTELYLASLFGVQLTVDVTDSLILRTKTIMQSIYGSHSSANTVIDMNNSTGVLYFPSTMTWQFIGTGGEINNTSSGGRTVFEDMSAFSTDSRFEYDDVVVNSDYTLSSGLAFSSTQVLGNLIIESGVTLNASSSSLDIGCGVSNSGTLTSGASGTVNFNGTVAQAISGSGTFNLYTVTASNSNGVTYSGTDTMDINTSLVVSSGTFTTGGRVRFLDAGSGMAQLGQVDGSVSGNIICQFRSNTLTNTDYRHFSSPVSGLTIGDVQYNASTCEACFYTWGFTGANVTTGSPGSTFTYDNGNVTGDFDDGWVAATNSTNSVSHQTASIYYIGPGGGSFNRSDYSFEAVGSANTGTILINNANGANMDYDAGNAADNNYNWALIGNPYASGVDWDLVFANTNTTDVESVMYIYNADGGGYVASNSGSNADIIPAFQGFVIRTSGASSAVEFQENDKSTTRRAFRKSIMDEERIYFHLTTAQTTKYNWGSIRFNQNTTPDFDEGMDAWHLTNPYPSPNIACVTPKMEDLQVYSTSQNSGHLEIPIKATGYYSDTYTLTLTNPEGIEGCFVLEDKFENKTIPFSSDSLIYSFQLSDTTTVARFVLHVYNLAKEVSTENSACAGDNNGAATLDLYDEQRAHNLFLYDDSSQVIATEFAITKSATFNNLRPGKYTLEVQASGLNCPTINEYFTIFEPAAMEADFEFAGDSLIFHTFEEITFSNKSQGGIASYLWNFGDQSTSTERSPKHSYSDAGIYKVELTVSNGNQDCDLTNHKFIQVNSNRLSAEDVVTDGLTLTPLEESILVRKSAGFSGPLQYSFYDVSGKVLDSGSLDEPVNSHRIAIPEAYGLVFFVLVENDQSYSLKLIR